MSIAHHKFGVGKTQHLLSVGFFVVLFAVSFVPALAQSTPMAQAALMLAWWVLWHRGEYAVLLATVAVCGGYIQHPEWFVWTWAMTPAPLNLFVILTGAHALARLAIGERGIHPAWTLSWPVIFGVVVIHVVREF